MLQIKTIRNYTLLFLLAATLAFAQKTNLETSVRGTLPIPNGGTGSTTATGTGDPVHETGPVIVTPNLQGIVNYLGTAVDVDTCVGNQGDAWFDSTDNRFEWCNLNIGIPETLELDALGTGDPGANGLMARTAEDVTSARTIQGTTDEIIVVDGDGVAGNPVISLPATINAATTGNAATATALATDPTDCTTDLFAIAIAANGDLTCATTGWIDSGVFIELATSTDAVSIGIGTEIAKLGVVGNDPAQVQFIVRAAPSQSVLLQEWQNSAGTVIAWLGLAGDINTTTDFRFRSGTAFGGLLNHNITALRTWTFPDVTGNVVLDTTQSFRVMETHHAKIAQANSGFLSAPSTGGAAFFAFAGDPPATFLRVLDNVVESFFTNLSLPPGLDLTEDITLVFLGFTTGTSTGVVELDGTIFVYPFGTAWDSDDTPTADADGPVTCTGTASGTPDGVLAITCTLTPTLLTGFTANSGVIIEWDRDDADSNSDSFRIKTATVVYTVQ